MGKVEPDEVSWQVLHRRARGVLGTWLELHYLTYSLSHCFYLSYCGFSTNIGFDHSFTLNQWNLSQRKNIVVQRQRTVSWRQFWLHVHSPVPLARESRIEKAFSEIHIMITLRLQAVLAWLDKLITKWTKPETGTQFLSHFVIFNVFEISILHKKHLIL